MNKPVTLRNFCLLILISFVFSLTAFAQLAEALDRGIVALNSGEQQIYVGWRLLKTDAKLGICHLSFGNFLLSQIVDHNRVNCNLL